MKTHLILVGCLTLLMACQKSVKQEWLLKAPAGEAYCQIDPNGKTILPNGRILTPTGKTYQIAPHPYGLTLSPDGKMAVTSNSGTGPFSITLLTDIWEAEPGIVQIPEGAETQEDLMNAVFMGLAILPDNNTLFVSGGQENKVFIFRIKDMEKIGEIDCGVVAGKQSIQDGYIGEMAMSKDGSRIYVLDQMGFRLLVIDTEKKEIIQEVPTGRYPFGITLSPDEGKVYVANVGMFEYKSFPDLDPQNLKKNAKDYPAFTYGSKEMVEGIENDSVSIPGLGDPNVPESFSVWTYESGEDLTLTSKIKTGFLVGEMVEDLPAVGGAGPNSLVASDDYVFVSNGNNDCISVLDPKEDTVITNIFLHPHESVKKLRGVIPFGLALSPDQTRLYVAESGINAVAVIDIPTLQVLGHIPVGWFPSKLQTSPDGKQLIVANAKGYGSGPNGGPDFQEGPEGTYIGRLMKGSVSIFDIPADEELASTTEKVVANNFLLTPKTGISSTSPVPAFQGQKESPIKYIVFISKENRTYDEVFGQLSNGKGEASMARYGMNASFSNRKGTQTIEGADIMINHHKLAHSYSISDNFYVDSDHSADGHRWLVNTYPNQWVETSVAAAYGGRRRMKANSDAPGNLALVGASGAIYPEDYNEAGSIWDHMDRNGISFFNFGFGLEMSGTYADSTLKYTGVKYLVNYPTPGPLYDHSSKSYATYNMAIPDQFRADMFIQEFKEKWGGEEKNLPSVLTILLPNDHGAGDRPQAGYPFRESYMLDNDLALGRIVEFLSSTQYWENMAIFVTEDDSQDGRDHIDAHRSLLMLISPYAKKDHISHQHYSFGSIFKTFWHILGIPYLNQYDAGATSMADMFTNEPDFTPYQALEVDRRIFDPQKALDPFDENFDWEAMVQSPELDDVEDFVAAHKEESKKN